MVDIKNISTSKLEGKKDIEKLLGEALAYLQSWEWCDKVLDGLLVDSFGSVLCVFYFSIRPKKGKGADPNVWIVVGDFPPAYIDLQSAKNSKEAVEVYCCLMEDWINCVKSRKSIRECYPIEVKPTLEYALMLENRIERLRSDFIPLLSDEILG